MKLRYIIFLVLALSSLTFAQKKRYLISPFQEVIPLDEHQSARMMVQAREAASLRAQNAACSNTVHDGFQVDQFAPPYNNFGATHKDVMGEWFVSNFTGTIDTVFWQTWGSVGALDSTLYVRIHRSAITPTAGPGAPGPYNPPCQNWGYWRNTDDADQGVAAFIEDATDTTWVSTIAGGTPSFPPFATDIDGNSELWGLGGYPAIDHAPNLNLEPLGRTNFVVMRDLPLPPTLDVVKGDAFFISMRVNSLNAHPFPVDNRTEFLTAGFDSRTPGYQDFYPSRNWKFYEHDSGPSNCAGVPTNQVKRGWVARGGFVDTDVRSVAAYLMWYSITTNDNTPPVLLSATSLGTVLAGGGARAVDVEWEDCNPNLPGSAGVRAAELLYSVVTGDDTVDFSLDMTNIGGNTWEAEIPAQAAWTTVIYSVVAHDEQGLTTTRPVTNYRTVAQQNEFFQVVSDTCADLSIKNTGTEIPSSAFFVAPPSTATNPKDDGTAGPFALGGPFYLFGQELNYAWIGVDGAVALSKTATDTLDVNANGSYTTAFDFPGAMKSQQRDTSTSGLKPKNFIAPYWNDLYYGDSDFASQWGHIRYQDLGCQFVVEWGGDSLGVFVQNGTNFTDKMTVRLVLNKCDGTMQFQYPDAGGGVDGNGLDTTATIGIQVDTIASLGNKAPWMFINRFNGPVEHNPVDGKCFKIYQTGATYTKPGWNMVSVSNVPFSYSKANVFPQGTTSAFAYTGSYAVTDPLTNGAGYWLKFASAVVQGAPGANLTSYSLPVTNGWNLIGSISCPVPTNSITGPVPVNASYYEYATGYSAVTSITPGKGYWIKTNGSGTLDLACNATVVAAKVDQNYSKLEGSSQLIVRDSRGGAQSLYMIDENSLKVPIERYELPPMPPTEVFDVRFGSGRSVEAYSSEKGKSNEYTVNLQASAYPVTLQYNVVAVGKSIVVSEMSEGKSISNTILNGNGVISVTNPSVSSIKVKVVDDLGTPKKFALSQNYPNPFNPVTRFSVDVPNSANVEISVFDILGHKIATLLSGQQEAGSKSIEWDGKDSHGVSSPSGMYFVRMNAGDFSEVRKIMLLK